jgi:hypothetical protein
MRQTLISRKKCREQYRGDGEKDRQYASHLARRMPIHVGNKSTDLIQGDNLPDENTDD